MAWQLLFAEAEFARARTLLSRPDVPQEYPDFNNHLPGQTIHEEDSPGNFTLLEDGDQLEFVAYDAEGLADEEWHMTWHWRRGP